MGSKSRGRAGWRANGDLDGLGGVCRARVMGGGASGDPVEKDWKQGR